MMIETCREKTGRGGFSIPYGSAASRFGTGDGLAVGGAVLRLILHVTICQQHISTFKLPL